MSRLDTFKLICWLAAPSVCHLPLLSPTLPLPLPFPEPENLLSFPLKLPLSFPILPLPLAFPLPPTTVGYRQLWFSYWQNPSDTYGGGKILHQQLNNDIIIHRCADTCLFGVIVPWYSNIPSLSLPLANPFLLPMFLLPLPFPFPDSSFSERHNSFHA